MKCLQLTSKSLIRKSDPVFLAKAPIMPHQYLFKNQGYNLGVLQAENKKPLLLITDYIPFLEQFREYYEQRFEVEEMGEDFVVPAHYEVVYGSVSFDNETDTDVEDDYETDEEADEDTYSEEEEETTDEELEKS